MYELEALLEVVFHRGSKMHDIVPRDEHGRSNYRLAAIRPSQIDLDDDDVVDFVAEIAERTGEFLQIVNFNLRGSQYAIAGTVRGLEVLEEEVEKRREISGGKRVVHPGARHRRAVPLLGAARRRRRLPALAGAGHAARRGSRRCSSAATSRTWCRGRSPWTATSSRRSATWCPPSRSTRSSPTTTPGATSGRRELCRKVVIELLAWQFASPVRWIETQDLLFIEEAAGGLGVERFVEIGVKSAPTVAGLATNTLKLPEYSHNTTEVLNAERDAAVLFATDTDPEPDRRGRQRRAARRAPEARPHPPPKPPPPAPAAATAPVGRSASRRHRASTPSDATLALIALSAKMRIDQIEPLDSIESITDGASSRRNQLLVDLGSELDLGAIDGAAEADLAGLKAQVTKLARTYKPFGPVLSDAINDQLRTVLGPSGKRPAAIAERVKKTWELGDGWVKHVTVEVALGTREGSSVRGGSLGGLHDGALADAATVDKVIDAAVAAVAARRGIAVVAAVGRRRAAGGVVDSAALAEFAEQVTGRDGVLASAARHDARPARARRRRSPRRRPSTDAELIDLVTAELGSDWPRLVAPAFDGRKAVLFDDRWASAREDLAKLWLMDEDEIDADWPQLSERFEGAGHVVGTQATWWQGKALAAGRNVHASLFGRAAAGAENPGKGRYSDEIAVVTGASKGSIAASVVAGAARRRRDGHRDHVQARRRPAGVLPQAVPRQRPLRRGAVGGARQHGVLLRHRRAGRSGSATSRPKALGRSRFTSRTRMTPTLLFPFAAPRVAGDLSDAGSRSEMEMKVLLWAVQRLIGGLSHIGSERDIASRLHVVLPGSPNRGMFGGDGAYGESKSALDAVVTRWKAETSWAQRVSLAHALIGWTTRHRPDGSQRRDRRARSRRRA